MSRKDKHNYSLDIAETVAERGTCLRRNYGSIIVSNDEIVSTGYTGAPRARKNCMDVGECIRAKLNIARGERYELCRSVHAEANAIIAASREHMTGATLYMCCTDPNTKNVIGNITSCAMCKRLIINAGITTVVTRDTANKFSIHNVRDWVIEDDIDGAAGY